MSPTKTFQHFGDLKKTINSGSHPSRLTINTTSQAIGKQNTKHRQPVIIYTHSPKIIRTHPRHFMALVQKLTGLPRPEDGTKNISREENDSSSGITDDDYAEESSRAANKMPNEEFGDAPNLNDLSSLAEPSLIYPDEIFSFSGKTMSSFAEVMEFLPEY